MKIRVTVYFLLACAICFTIFWLVRSNRQWEETNFTNRQDLLNTAAYNGDIALAEASIAGGAGINYQGRDGTRNSRLWIAVTWGQVEMVRFLLDHGADPNGGKGQNPLLSLCHETRGHTPPCTLAMAKLLLEHGADPNVHQQGYSPLAAARLSEPFKTNLNADLIALLQQHGAKD